MAGMLLDAGLRGRARASASTNGSGYTPVASSSPTRPTAASTMGVSTTGAKAGGNRTAGHMAVYVGMASVALLVFIYFSLPEG